MVRAVSLLVALVAASPGLAADAAFVEGQFSTPPGCAILLTAKEFAEFERYCALANIVRNERLDAWTATMTCECPDTLRVSFLNDEVSVRGGGEAAFGEPFVRFGAAR